MIPRRNISQTISPCHLVDLPQCLENMPCHAIIEHLATVYDVAACPRQMPRKGRGLHHRSRREHAVTDDSERLAMDDFTAAFATALALIVGLDGDLLAIVSLSLMVSMAAVGLAAVCGLPLGAAVVA